MEKRSETSISKLLSLVLRHRPEAIGIELDPGGWTEVDTLLQQLAANGRLLSRKDLEAVVHHNAKKRFQFNGEGSKIRAVQGHSVAVDLGYLPQQPPAVLYHGTARQHITSILNEGLRRQNRLQVHLSADRDTARAVGQRHGKPVVFLVAAGAMYAAGHLFYQAANGVWLTNAVPPGFLQLVETERPEQV